MSEYLAPRSFNLATPRFPATLAAIANSDQWARTVPDADIMGSHAVIEAS